MTGMDAPLPIVIGVEKGMERAEERLPEPDAMCKVVPVSKNHSDV